MNGKTWIRRQLAFGLCLSTLAFALSACVANNASPTQAQTPTQFGQPNAQVEVGLVPDQREVLAAQAQQLRRVEVTVVARVFKLLRDDTKGLPHQRFLLKLDNGTTVLIAHDTKMAPRVPINVGDLVRIHGEYIWNEKGGVIHWTHHSDNGRHEPGWIEFNGQRYQ